MCLTKHKEEVLAWSLSEVEGQHDEELSKKNHAGNFERICQIHSQMDLNNSNWTHRSNCFIARYPSYRFSDQ